MEDDKKTTGIIIGVVVLALIIGGIFWAVNNNSDDEASQTTNQTQQTTDDQTAEEQTTSDIVGLASATPDLSTLVTAVTAADLVETLQGEGPFTVFAPTNAAFEALPEGTLDDLLKEENKDQLAAVLTYHVVSGKVMAADLTDGQEITTVQGETLTVKIDGDMVHVVDTQGNEAMVTTADVEASNGVVHIIDKVVLPN